MSRTKTCVKIDNKEYTIVGDEDEEYIHKVAILVDREMKNVRDNCSKLSTSMTAVLTAINLADKLVRQRIKYIQLEKRMKEQFASKNPVNKGSYNNIKNINQNNKSS